jgi:small subunit ribosomal protein S6
MAKALVNGKLLGIIDIPKKLHLRPYEAVILVHPDASEDDQKTLFKKNKGIIEEMFKGSVNHLDFWGKRSLANPINKITKAAYFHTTFMSEPEAIAELERTMRINDKVLRFLHTRLDERVSLTKYVEDFKTALGETAAREREREAKFQARKSARSGGREMHRRDDARPRFNDGGDDDMAAEVAE